MRSTLFLAALAAGCVNAYEKRVYVTDWTTVTVTKTVTAPAVTETVQPAHQAVQNTVTTTTQGPGAPPVQTESSELAKKSTVIVPISSTTQAVPSVEIVEPSSTLAQSTSTTAAAVSTTSATTNTYQSAVLYNHNIHRSNHSVSSVEWSADLEASAQTLAARCVYQHDT